jgi:hypothetical protein
MTRPRCLTAKGRCPVDRGVKHLRIRIGFSDRGRSPDPGRRKPAPHRSRYRCRPPPSTGVHLAVPRPLGPPAEVSSDHETLGLERYPGEKRAVTDREPLMVTLHLTTDPVHAPDQSTNIDPGRALALNVTIVAAA